MALDLPADLRARVDAARAEMEAEAAARPADDATRQKALARCSVVLSHKACTRGELETKLRGSDFEPDVIAWSLDLLEQSGAIDDAQYARMFVASRTARGHGLKRISADLGKKGISRELVQQAWQDYCDEQERDHGATSARDVAVSSCARALGKKYDAEALADTAVRSKAMRWLAGRGYSFSEIDAAIAQVRTGADVAD